MEGQDEVSQRISRKSLQERFGKVLSISTINIGARISDRFNSSSSAYRSIRTIENFTEHYDLGKEVMPSTHSYMKVCFCKRKSDGNECVVKIRFKPQCFRSEEDEKHWRHNTEFLLNLPQCNGLCQIYDVFEDNIAFYIVMEKIEGMDLFETVHREGAVSVIRAKNIVQQLLQATAHLHAHNAVHKDLKLENVMIDASPKSSAGSSVKLIDFDTLDRVTPQSPISRDVVGTDQYIAQEAYAGKYSPLSDIFAIGVIAYKLLCGKFPFHDHIFDDEAGENWVGSPKMQEIRGRLKVAKIDFAHRVFVENPLAQDLISNMLAYSETLRPTAADALEHVWFTGREDRARPPASPLTAPARPQTWISPFLEDSLDADTIVAEEGGSPITISRKRVLLRR